MSAYQLDFNIPPPPPSLINDNEEIIVKEVWSGKRWYSSMRKNYQRAVCVMWENNQITIEPVCNLIDFENEEICEKMIPVLYNCKVSVDYYLCKSSLCAFCTNKRNRDNFLCLDCEDSTSWLNVFIKDEHIKRMNKDTLESTMNKETLESTMNIPPCKRKYDTIIDCFKSIDIYKESEYICPGPTSIIPVKISQR